MNHVQAEKKQYKIKIRNISLDGYEHNALLAEGTVRTSNINNSVSRLKVAKLLESKGIEFDGIMGTIIEHHDNYAVVGHEGSDCGNIKTIDQVEISWEEVAE